MHPVLPQCRQLAWAQQRSSSSSHGWLRPRQDEVWEQGLLWCVRVPQERCLQVLPLPRELLLVPAWPAVPSPSSRLPWGCGGHSWLPCSLGAPCPCWALAALTGAAASKQRTQCLLAWLLPGYFLSQYSQAGSCVFSKNLVLELGLDVCGVSSAVESWRKVLDKQDVPVTPVHHGGKGPAVWLTTHSLQCVILLRAQPLIPAGHMQLQTSFPRGGVPA